MINGELNAIEKKLKSDRRTASEIPYSDRQKVLDLVQQIRELIK